MNLERFKDLFFEAVIYSIYSEIVAMITYKLLLHVGRVVVECILPNNFESRLT
jgi:hypothetical protein